jgi:glutamate N-acetyltransferase/amino-acid N-acetyltransferase
MSDRMQNAFPGAPVKIGRGLLTSELLGAVVINNKISNVCARGGGVGDSEQGEFR